MTDQEFWLGVGVRCLRNLLKWPDWAIDEWAEKHRAVFAIGSFDTELPSYYFDVYFVPRGAPLSERAAEKLCAHLGLVLQKFFTPMFEEGFDWEPVRLEVDSLLRKWGTSLQEAVDDMAHRDIRRRRAPEFREHRRKRLDHRWPLPAWEQTG